MAIEKAAVCAGFAGAGGQNVPGRFPQPVTAPPRRHSKPHISADGGGPVRKLIVAGGRAAGLEPSDIIHAITAATGLDGEAVRNVRVLEQFAFVEVPEKDADRVVGASHGLRIEQAPQ